MERQSEELQSDGVKELQSDGVME